VPQEEEEVLCPEIEGSQFSRNNVFGTEFTVITISVKLSVCTVATLNWSLVHELQQGYEIHNWLLIIFCC
jgi:hypothetical protein